MPVIGRLPDGLCLADGLPPAHPASVFVRGRPGADELVVQTIEAAVRDLLGADDVEKVSA